MFPTPRHDAVNALNHLRAGGLDRGATFLGGLGMTRNEVRISARVVLELLAGRLPWEDFLTLYKFQPGDSPADTPRSPFERCLRDGRLISEVRVEHCGDEQDDDWLIFRFGDNDPAVSKFKAPTGRDPKR